MNILDVPMYTPAAVGRLVGLQPQRVKRWLVGYQYSYSVSQSETVVHKKGPVVHREGTGGFHHASFLDLVDLIFVKRFLDHGLTLQKLRLALDEASRLLGGHHFAQRTFFTDGREIFLQVRDEADSLLQLLANGQWVIAPVIKQVAHQIDFSVDSGFAERWFPLGKENHVVVDPAVSFGSPSLYQRSIKTANIYDLYKGENKNVNTVAEWMEVTPEEVHASVKFEESLRAA